MSAVFEFSLGGNRQHVLSAKDIKAYKETYPGLDVESALSEAAKRSRNLSIVDGRALHLFIKNELSMARSRAVAKIREAQAKMVKHELAQRAEVAEQKDVLVTTPPVENRSAVEAAKPKRVSSTVELFKSMKDGAPQIMIQTTAGSLDVFIPALSVALSEAIHSDPSDVDGLIKAVLQRAFPLGIKIAGYKVESIKEERVLISGYIEPNEADMVGHADI